MKIKNIAFIGLGKLGMPCAEVIQSKGYNVFGYDINRLIKSDKILIFDNIEETVKNAELIFISVPTPHDPNYDGSLPTSHLKPKDFDYDIVKNSLIEINKFCKSKTVVLISTVLPGVVRKQLSILLNKNNLIYNPYLIAMGSVAWDMVNPEMVIIGSKDGKVNIDIKVLKSFYETIMENKPRYEIGTWEEAECIKIFYNTFISAKLSLVNMILDVSEKLGNINVDIVTNALKNSSQRIMGPKYMTAGMGDGGACHPRDNIALRFLSKELDLGYDLFDAIMLSREKQAENLAKLLVKQAKLNNLKIYIHGKAYKPEVPYCEGSYSILVGHYCNKLGYTPTYLDYFINSNIKSIKGVVLLAHNSKITYPDTHYDEIQQKLYCEFQDGSIIIDPWRNFTTRKNIKVIYYGKTN